MNVTFFGTTTLLFDDGKDALMFDGHFTRPSFLRYVMGTMETDTALEWVAVQPGPDMREKKVQ